MADTYNNGWNLQSFFDALNPSGAYTNEQLLAQQYPLDPSRTNQQYLKDAFGYDNPLQQLSAPLPDTRDSSGDAGELFDKLVMSAVGAGVGGGIASWAGGLGGAAGGAEGGLVDAGMGVPELGLAEQSLAPMMPPAIAPETSAGYAASPWGSGGTLYSLTDPAAVAEAGMAGAGFAPTSELNPSSGGFSAPTGTSSAIQQLVKALTGGAAAGAGGGIQGFLQGGSPGSQGYVRKSRPPLTQPAFLGDQGQQPLGSAEDTAFNDMVAGRGEDTSTRARQMAAQLRGKPGFFGFRSG